jgi:hypothetical protein
MEEMVSNQQWMKENTYRNFVSIDSIVDIVY